MAASDQGGHSRIYRETGGSSGSTALVFASGGVARGEAGSSLSWAGVADFTSARVTLPGSLGRGYIPLVARGVKATATASGLVTAWTTALNPALVNTDITSGYSGYRWATANLNPLHFEPVRVPLDFSSAGGLNVHTIASGAAANATNAKTVMIRFMRILHARGNRGTGISGPRQNSAYGRKPPAASQSVSP